ncbi:hypothetical protein Tco_0575922 [Tanacetum coccineum]
MKTPELIKKMSFSSQITQCSSGRYVAQIKAGFMARIGLFYRECYYDLVFKTTFGDQTFAGDNGRLKKEDEKPGVIGDDDVDSRTTRHWHFVEEKEDSLQIMAKLVYELDVLQRIRTSLLRAGQKGRKHEDISVILRTFESKIRPPCPKVSHALEEIDKCITSDDPECVPVRTYESGNPFYLFMHVAGKGGFVAVWQLDTDKKFLPTYETKLVIFYELCLTDVLQISCADNRIHFLKMPSMEILQSISGIKFYSLFDDHESSEVQDCERNHQPSDDVTNLPKLGWGSTILDVGCGVASFGYTGMDMVPAALTNLPLWVMNVVPLNASDTSPNFPVKFRPRRPGDATESLRVN